MNQFLDGNVLDQVNRAVPGALVYIYDFDGHLSSLADANGASIQNPVTAGEDGYWSAYVEEEGFYTLKFFWAGRERFIEANRLIGRSPIEQTQVNASLSEAYAGKRYETLAEGENATDEGVVFFVSNGDDPRTYQPYQRTASGSVAVDPPATSSTLALADGSAKIGYKAPVAPAIVRNVNARLGNLALRPEDFGTFSADPTANRQLLQAWINELGDGVHGDWAGVDCVIDERIQAVSKDRMSITGQARLTMRDDAPTGEQHAIMLVQDCTNSTIADLIGDGNRYARLAGLTPGYYANPGSGHLFQIKGGEDCVFRRIKMFRATTDCIYIRGRVPSDKSTYPLRMILDQCEGWDAVRLGIAFIGSRQLTALNCKGMGSNGASPEAGVGCEPSATDIHGNEDLRIINLETSGNAQRGAYFGAKADVPNGGLLDVSGRMNGTGLVEVSRARGVEVVARPGDHPDTIDGGIVTFSGFAKNSSVSVQTTEPITANSNRPILNVEPEAAGVVVKEVRATFPHSIPLLAYRVPNGRVSNLTSHDCGYNGAVIGIASTATGAYVRGVEIKRCANRGLFSEAVNLDISDWYVEDFGAVAALQLVAGGAKVTKGKVKHSSGVNPGGSIRALRFDAAPAVLADIDAPEYNDGNLVTGAGTAFANTRMWGNSPSLTAKTRTYDPPSIAPGASHSFDITISYASATDSAKVNAPYDLQGLILTERCIANGVRVTLTNPAGAASAVDLPSGVWPARLLKS